MLGTDQEGGQCTSIVPENAIQRVREELVAVLCGVVDSRKFSHFKNEDFMLLEIHCFVDENFDPKDTHIIICIRRTNRTKFGLNPHRRIEIKKSGEKPSKKFGAFDIAKTCSRLAQS